MECKTKLNMQDTTLICVDCRDLTRTVPVMEHCERLADFGAIKLLTHLTTDYPYKVDITNISTHVMYSIFMLKEIYKYIDTKYMLVVQADGFILNPDSWDDTWKEYDYIGPLMNQLDVVGNGGFSFRSKRLMEFMASKFPDWDITEDSANRLQSSMSYYEDGAISGGFNREMVNNGLKIAPLEIGGKFAAGGNKNDDYYYPHPFGFHGCWRTIDLDTGFVHQKIREDNDVKIPDILDLYKTT